MTKFYPVIPKRSEESYKSLLPQNLRFFTSFRMTDKSKDVIGKRSEKSHKSLIPHSLRFFALLRMTGLTDVISI